MNYLEDFAIIQLQGSDAIKILHNLATNSIHERDFSTTYTCILTPNGRFMFDFHLIQQNLQKYIVINKNFQEDFIKYISMYKMSADLHLEKTSLKLQHSFAKIDGFLADSRSQKLGFYAIKEAGNFDATTVYNANRISLKIADGFWDLTQKESIILDYGFDNLNAISYTKGCYLGQELISRTKHTGVLRKKVCGLKSQNDLTKGVDIFQNDEKVGKVLGGFNGEYLALVNFERANFDTQFAVENINVVVVQ